MNTLASARAVPASPRAELSLLRALVMLGRLRLIRWRNQLRRAMGRDATAGSGVWSLAWILFPVALLALFSLQSSQLFATLAHEYGPEGLTGRALLLSSLLCASVLIASASGSGLPGRPADDELEWLMTLPARAWVLQLAKLGEAALLNPFGWMVLFPFLTGLGLEVGLGVAAPLVALALCLPLFAAGALLQGLSDAASGWFASHPALRVARAVGAGFGVLVFSLWLGFPALARAHLLPVGRWLEVPSELGWLPFCEPARVILLLREAPLRALGWLSLFAVEAGALSALGVLALRRAHALTLLQGRSGRRGPRGVQLARGASAGSSWFGPVIAKDLLWLRRNAARSSGLLLNAALANAAAILWLSRAADGDPARWGAAVFGVGCWLLLLLVVLLEAERPALWTLATLPRSISRLFLPKALVAAALAAGAALPVLAYGARTTSSWTAALPALGYAGAGILLCACLQTALWLGRASPNRATSPLMHSWRMLQLMFLAGFFAEGFASVSAARMLPPLVLIGALAFAVWKSALARVPFALDPSAVRVPEPGPVQALLAVLVFRVLQLQLQRAAAESGLVPALSLAVSFVAAAVVVLMASLLWLHGAGVTRLPQRLALGVGTGLGSLLREGVAWSIPAIAISAGYWWLSRLWAGPAPATPLSALAESSAGTFVALTVLAAPPLEELVFRGLLYRSLRSSAGLWPSLLISSAVFAVGHPGAAALPILCLGACCALALERSRSLFAAMLVHALYNGCIAWVAVGF